MNGGSSAGLPQPQQLSGLFRFAKTLPIPLLLEPFDPTQLDWMMSDITNIPFHQSWATGFAQIVQKVDKIRVPKPLEDGGRITLNFILPDTVLEERQESLAR